MQQKLGRDASAAAIQAQNARGGGADTSPDTTPGSAGAAPGPPSATFVRGLRSLVITNRKRLETRRAEVEKAMLGRDEVPRTTPPPHAAPAAPAKTAAASVAPPSGGMHRQVSPGGLVSPGGGGGGGVVSAPPAGHMTLQLLPVDDATHGAVAQAGFNPLLELTFRCVSQTQRWMEGHMPPLAHPLTCPVPAPRTRKSLGSVLQHVRTKWAAVPQALGMGPGAELRLLPREAVRINALAGWGDECGFLAAGEALRPGPGGSCDGAVVEVRYGWLAPGLAVPVCDAPAMQQQQQQHSPSVGAQAQHHGAWGQAAATPQGEGHSGGKRAPRESMLSLLLGPTPDSRDHRPGAPAGHGSAAAAVSAHGNCPARQGGATPMTPEYVRGTLPLGEAHLGMPAGQLAFGRPPLSAAWQQQMHMHQGDLSILPPFAEEESLTALAQRWICQSSAPQSQPHGMQPRYHHGGASRGAGGSMLPDLLGNGGLGLDEMELLRDMSTRRAAPPRGDVGPHGGGGGGAARSLQVAPPPGDLGLGPHYLTNDVLACLNSMPFQLGAEPSWLAPDQAGGAAAGGATDEPASFRGIMSTLR